jgi:hypothetical protein
MTTAEFKNLRTISTMCPICGETHEINVYATDLAAYMNGALVQDAFPYLNADEREMIISGICPRCWDKMWG